MHTRFIRFKGQLIGVVKIKAGGDVGPSDFEAHKHEAHQMKPAELFLRNAFEGVDRSWVFVVYAVLAEKADF